MKPRSDGIVDPRHAVMTLTAASVPVACPIASPRTGPAAALPACSARPRSPAAARYRRAGTPSRPGSWSAPSAPSAHGGSRQRPRRACSRYGAGRGSASRRRLRRRGSALALGLWPWEAPAERAPTRAQSAADQPGRSGHATGTAHCRLPWRGQGASPVTSPMIGCARPRDPRRSQGSCGCGAMLLSRSQDHRQGVRQGGLFGR